MEFSAENKTARYSTLIKFNKNIHKLQMSVLALKIANIIQPFNKINVLMNVRSVDYYCPLKADVHSNICESFMQIKVFFF